MNGMAAVASETFTSTSAPIQYAAVKAFSGGIEIERYLWNARKILKTLGIQIHDLLLNTGIECPEPDGAFYLFINFSNYSDKLKSKNILTSLDLTTNLLENTGVALLPGSVFGRPEEEYTARLSYVDFDGARALAAAENVPAESPLPENFMDTYCSHLLEGTKAIVAWAKSL
jgi:aspartate aminotransferase